MTRCAYSCIFSAARSLSGAQEYLQLAFRHLSYANPPRLLSKGARDAPSSDFYGTAERIEGI